MGICLLGNSLIGSEDFNSKFHVDSILSYSASYTWTTSKEYDFVAVCFTKADDNGVSMNNPSASSGVTHWTAAVNSGSNPISKCWYGYADQGQKIPVGSTISASSSANGQQNIVFFGVYFDSGIASATLTGTSSDGTWSLNTIDEDNYNFKLVISGSSTIGSKYNSNDIANWNVLGFTLSYSEIADLVDGEFKYSGGALYFKKDEFTTLEDWLAWVGENPLTVYYPTY